MQQAVVWPGDAAAYLLVITPMDERRKNAKNPRGNVPRNSPDFYPPPKMAPKETKHFGHKKLCRQRSFPQTKRNQEHNTIGTHFTILETALGPLWPFTAPNKYIRRGARRKKTNPNDKKTQHLPRGRRQIAVPRQMLCPEFASLHTNSLCILCASSDHCTSNCGVTVPSTFV